MQRHGARFAADVTDRDRQDAWNVMRVNRIHHLVVTKANRVVGVLSDRDAGGRRGAAVRANSTVADLMNAPAVTVVRRITEERHAVD